MPRLITPDGKVIELPAGTTEADVAGNLGKYDPQYGKKEPPTIEGGIKNIATGALRGALQEGLALPHFARSRLGLAPPTGFARDFEKWVEKPTEGPEHIGENIGQIAGNTAMMYAIPASPLAGLAAKGVGLAGRAAPALGTLAALWHQPWLGFLGPHNLYNMARSVVGTAAPYVARGARETVKLGEKGAEGWTVRRFGEEAEKSDEAIENAETKK